MRRIGLALGLVIGTVVSVVLLTSPQESTKIGIERPDCFYGFDHVFTNSGSWQWIVTAKPIPGCPTRPDGRPGPSLTPLTPEERERLLRRYPHG
jgi:hypothetical protein